MEPCLLESITDTINSNCQLSLSLLIANGVQGGDICQSYCIKDKEGLHTFFVKIQKASLLPIFIAEYNSLLKIKKSKIIRSPKPIGYGAQGSSSFLILEFLSFSTTHNDAQLGKQLASLHKHSYHREFGFFEDNFIGTIPQSNSRSNNWLYFWIHQRLLPQLELAYKKGFSTHLKPFQTELLNASKQLLEHHKPTPSLVHGDLWGGNKAFLTDGTPVIFDPASYYGDREVDIAMSRLFGGFSDSFYTAYNKEWTLPKDSKERLPLYNLYHQLNHLNLFGSTYLNDCIHAIERLITSP